MPSAPSRTPSASTNSFRARARPSAGASARVAVGRRRQVPWLVAGVVLVVGFALAFATVSIRLTGGRPVLVVTGPLSAGHVLGPGDLRSVNMPAASGLATVPAAQEPSVLGRALSVPIAAGTLLSPAEVRAGSSLPAGEAVVGLAVKAGQYPPALASGDQVEVVDTTGAAASQATTQGTTPGPVVPATVVGVDVSPAGSSAAAVISLQVGRSDAATVAGDGAAGQASVVLVPSSGAS